MNETPGCKMHQAVCGAPVTVKDDILHKQTHTQTDTQTHVQMIWIPNLASLFLEHPKCQQVTLWPL